LKENAIDYKLKYYSGTYNSNEERY